MKSSICWSQAAKKMICVGAAGALLAVTVAPFGNVETAEAATSTDNAVTCAAYRAAEPAPEILGLTGYGADSTSSFGISGDLSWSTPRSYIFGTDYNSNPNPFYVNSVKNVQENTDTYKPSVIDTANTRKGGPTASLGAYGENNNTAVWDQLPDVILGNSSGVDYNDADHAQAAGAANGNTSYTTIGVDYDSTDNYTMIDSMYDLAAAGDAVVAKDSSKQLRYGSATAIAKDYEAYVRGTQGYILKKLGNKAKKTVARVCAYDSASDTYTISKTGVSEGTAAASRYLEAVQNVATNIADNMDANESGTVTVTAKQLASVDLILVGGQSRGETLDDSATIMASFSNSMLNKTYWVDDGGEGSCYGVVMNSVENAQNIGRILGCLYPEYIDQSDWIAYYYQNFYHIKTGSLAEVIDHAMDGVRNANAKGSGDSATAWSEGDVKDYKESSVQTKLDQGMAYLANNASSVSTLLTPTSNYGTVKQVVTVSNTSQTYKAKALKKAKKTFKLSATAEGKVTYKKSSGTDKLSVNSAGKVTVKKGTAKGTYKIKVKATAAKTSNLAKASTTVTVKVKVK